jgi:hypothetical protein
MLREGAGKTGDAQSRLRALPEATCGKRRLGTHKTSEQLPDEQKIGNPYWLLAHRYSLKKLLEQRAFCRPGGYGGAAAPDPIPNSAVKRSSADGTSSQDAGE